MKRGVKRAVLTILACALVVFVLPAFADSQARIVRLSYLDGTVEIDRNTGDGFEKAIVNMPVSQGAKLWTHEDGEAEVEFEDGSTVRLAPDSKVSFDQLSLRSDGGKVTLVNVEDGTVYFNVQHKDQNDFRAVFAGHDVKLAKTSHFRAEVKDRQVSIAVFKGELELQDTEGEKKLKKNETASFDLDNPSGYEVAKGVSEGQFDWWDKEREEYHTQYAYRKNSTYASSAYGGPSYGWSDLSYYGNMFYLPGWGNVWRPYDVAYNWDPFSVGYWMYYPWGYTWVSPYPWGWMPYRYGNWLFAPGYGWVWQPTPGGYSNWYPRPRYTNPPSSYRPPAPPSQYPTRPNPGRSVVPVGNPNDTPIQRWTPRGVPNRQNPVVTRDGMPGGRPGQVDRKAPGTGGTASGSHARQVPTERGNVPENRGTGNTVDRGSRPMRGVDNPRTDTPRSAPSPRPAPTPHVAPSSTPHVAPAPSPHVAPAPTPHLAPAPTPHVAPAPSYSPPPASSGAHSSSGSSTRSPK